MARWEDERTAKERDTRKGETELGRECWEGRGRRRKRGGLKRRNK